MGLPKFRPVRRCIFCSNKPNSREHAWPEWALKRLSVGHKIFGNLDGLAYHDPNQRQVRVRCVCVPCNTGWMKALEDAVIPPVSAMMFGVAVPLDLQLCATLAHWALKTSMVWE